ncbi:nitroimidazol reductase NimA-like FMN-containing flavoprotein (pyridoxamine 5'-phosphate oxidase superfamily) [Agromyces terreus]|uniref:Nitroimidazol reductase NimA-like FMN-containing flavoprotein (Pyridoxamine 5'-phosphate oxidase superfamily) n=1 Tax=Agromyces terreus TaxID=424795 RepID=A0A9X2H7I8_9MICO|nr:pyridoxamine 5'-phosphate oxidase family protein [Agromyces terreus]MCP2370874.1 nitroimidazol reductase NimA-like FMN-containing flavoprotein (pyridoxamine 5'-phosphate oxidase superfamily) [Agromyces terreus]
MSMATDETPSGAAATARRILDANAYLTLATADASGRPWATPVWFAVRDLREFVWVSRPARRHSANIAARAEIALTVYDSTTPVGEASAVYAEALAEPVPDDGVEDALDVYNAGCRASGLRPWAEGSVTGAAPHRLYRAVASHLWVLDEREDRVEVF